MEYLEFNYKEIDKSLSFSAYERFVLSNYTYKQYLFDLKLSLFDQKMSKFHSSTREFFRNLQFLSAMPYFVVGSVYLFKYKRGWFQYASIYKEERLAFVSFVFVLFSRVAQKCYVKYYGDTVLEAMEKAKTNL